MPRQIAQLTGDVDELRLHVRSTHPDFEVRFDVDSLNSLSLKAKNTQQGDGTYDWKSAVYMIKHTPLCDSILSKTAVDHQTSAFSLCVTIDAGGLRIDAGDGTRIFDRLANLNATKDTKISVYPAPQNTDIVDFAVRYKPEHKKCRFTSADQLANYLAASSDSIESYWQWLDCQTDAPAVVSGGRYRLATVRNGDAYDIVYISGDDKGRWQPLDVKGSMTPTSFIGHYDVTWCDSKGYDVGEGVYASIDANGILTLSFTPLRSELRFSRLRR